VLGAELPRRSDDYLSALAAATVNSPAWTLRGGTREVLRGLVARGLGLR
jgi:hypothetical protein